MMRQYVYFGKSVGQSRGRVRVGKTSSLRRLDTKEALMSVRSHSILVVLPPTTYVSGSIEITPVPTPQTKAEIRRPKIHVFLRSQSPADLPHYSASKTFVEQLLAFAPRPVRWIDEAKTALQIVTDETWRQLRDRVRGKTFVYKYGQKVTCPTLLPPGPASSLDLCYPERGRETGRHPHQAMLDACREAKRRQEEQLQGAV